MIITADIDAWGEFADGRVIEDLIAEISLWRDSVVTLYRTCSGETSSISKEKNALVSADQNLGKIQGREEACSDLIAMLEDIRDNFADLFEARDEEEKEDED